MAKFSCKELHLAAFIKSNGAEFLGFENNCFVFESEKDLSQWRVEHSNSCCRRVDQELINLRKFLKRS
jgi:hypothetical protein